MKDPIDKVNEFKMPEEISERQSEADKLMIEHVKELLERKDKISV